MRTTTCLCGAELSAETMDALVDVVLAHAGEAHPEVPLTEGNVRDYLDAAERLSDATERLEKIGAVEVHEATPERLDDLLGFFDRDAFAGNPAWAGCYCMCHHCGSAEWPQRRAAENRADLIERVRAGTTTGLLAYVDGKPAAWCNASPRSTLPEHRGHDGQPDDRVGCIVCFVVAPPYRRHGLAAKLLDAALESFGARGFTHAEAYPRRETRGDPGAYHGPLGLYLSRGFTEVAEEGNVAEAAEERNIVTVQKVLAT